MAKIEWVHHRLERWALWMDKGGGMGGGYGACPMWVGARVDNEVRQEAMIPINDEECSKTHEAIQALPEPLNVTIATYYLYDSGHTQRKLGISASVLSQRIDQSHKLLSQVFIEAQVKTAKTHEDPSWYKLEF